MSPTQRTKAKLASEGWPLVAVVEKWNPHAKIRQDLFGIIDVLAVGPNGTLAVQTTSGSNVAARATKIAESDAIAHIRDAGWRCEIHGWRKVKVRRGGKAVRWECRVLDVS